MRASRCFSTAAACWLLLAGTAILQAEQIEFTVEAGMHDRRDVPVQVSIALAADEANLAGLSATVTGPDGKALPAQVTSPGLLQEQKDGQQAKNQRLHFILPELKAGETAKFAAEISQGQAAAGFHWQDTPGEYSELLFDERPIARYMYKAIDDSSPAAREQTYKVYHHLYDPAGKLLVTKGPGGQFTHHRGLFFGFNKITYDGNKTADVWHATKGSHQSHEDFLSSEAGPVLGRHRLAIDWHGEQKEVFAKEQREVTVYAVPEGTLVEWSTRLQTTGGPIKLDGDPQHAGFHFRAAQEVSAKTAKQTYYVRPDGTGKPGTTINWAGKDSPAGTINQPWKGMSFVLGDQRYSVAYLDKPSNPKEARYSERDYGRFGSYFETTVTEEQPLELTYRVWLQAGELTADDIARLSADFVEPVKVTLK